MGNSQGQSAPPSFKDLARALKDGEVQVAATEILRVAGVPAYHTSVILDGREFYFDSQGIVSAPPLWSHLIGGQQADDLQTEVFSLGESLLNSHALVQFLTAFFHTGTYDILVKNCNAFTDAAVYFLCRQRLPGRYTRLERMLASTRPMSMSLLNAVLWATQPPSEEGDGAAQGSGVVSYTVNPLADGFSVEDIVARCDALDAEAGDEKTVADLDLACITCSLGRWDPATASRSAPQRRCSAVFSVMEDELVVAPLPHDTVSTGCPSARASKAPSRGNLAGAVLRMPGYKASPPPVASPEADAFEMARARLSMEQARDGEAPTSGSDDEAPSSDVSENDSGELPEIVGDFGEATGAIRPQARSPDMVAEETGTYGVGVGRSCVTIRASNGALDQSSGSVSTASSASPSCAPAWPDSPSSLARVRSMDGLSPGAILTGWSESPSRRPLAKIQETAPGAKDAAAELKADRWHSLGRATQYTSDVHHL